MSSVFASYEKKAWPYQFQGELLVHSIAGGIPTNPKVIEGWIRSKGALGQNAKDDLIRQAVAEVAMERATSEKEISIDDVVAEVAKNKSLNGFKRDPEKGLYIEGRQLKAALKEAASVAYSAGKLLNNGKNSWGRTSKGIQGFVAEHVCVVEDKLFLNTTEISSVNQRFVHTFRGSSIQYEECVENARIEFTVKTDYDFSKEQWAMLWLTGQEQGIGASRSQGFGRYTVEEWREQ